MQLPAHISFLQSSLFIFLVAAPSLTSSQVLRWPYSLPDHAKYYPEDEVMIKRDIDIQQKLQQHPPSGIRKMGSDPGEKFYLDYWSFADETDFLSNYGSNTSMPQFGPSVPVHTNKTSERDSPLARYFGMRISGRSIFDRRDFQCPAGTAACTSISRPNSCCASGTTCQIIQDTGLGDVGCCPAGEVCASSVSTCAAGYTSCPNNSGGGCCLPGYGCVDIGCVLTATVTVVVVPTTSTPPPTPSTTTVTSTTIVPAVPTSSSPPEVTTTTTTSSTTISQSTATIISTTTTTRSMALTCSTGYRSCPASLGGGCCPSTRACARNDCPAFSTSATVVAPVRPTTDTTTLTTTDDTTSASSTAVEGCPTGFYACSAYYQGGCCQVGRNCDTTSCPASLSTTLLSANGITAVAPTGSGITAPGTLLTGNCATGWSSCGATDGGGCCPTGYACGTSCTATASGVAGDQVGKVAPNTGMRASGQVDTSLFIVLSVLSGAVGAGISFF